VTRLPRPDLWRRRRYVQHLAGAPLPGAEQVVRLLGAVQSQDYLGAKWSVGQRAQGATDARIDEAFNAGRILRTHVLRPTWHFVTPEDIHWMLELTAPRVQAIAAYQNRKVELDAPLLARCLTVIAGTLEGGRQRTRADVGAALERAGIVAVTQRLAHVMMHAELEGLVCSGALQGKQHTYALLAERAPSARILPREQALAELARRFFIGHGPASLKQMAWWSGLTTADAKRGHAMIERELDRVDVEGTRFWFDPSVTVPARESLTAYLLPEYDEALIGFGELGVSDLARVRRGRLEIGRFDRPVIIGGTRVGTWRRTIEGGSAVMETLLFAPLEPAMAKALAKAIDRYATFLGMPVTTA
jgi:hypothetical protein